MTPGRYLFYNICEAPCSAGRNALTLTFYKEKQMSESIISKWCPHCKTNKPVAEFYKNRSRYDGLAGWCKEGYREYHRVYAKSEQCKAAARKYRRSEQGKKTQNNSSRLCRKAYPAQCKARNAVNHAIRAGKLPPIKLLECVYCGEQAEYYHHWAGYEPEHWFDIIPLCRKCDRKAHQKKQLN